MPTYRLSSAKVRLGRAALLAIALSLAGYPTVDGQAQQTASSRGQASGGVTYKSAEAAYEHGMSAWRSGYFDQAIAALRYAADHQVFLAQYSLARLLADSSTPYTDHGAAYQIYLKIVADYGHIDPDDDQRAVVVARSLTALAGYVRTGLPQINLRPNPARAVTLLKTAAQFFNDEDAQFDLAKLYLQGDGVAPDPRAGLHFLSVLSQRGHPGAQALLADLYWRGRHGLKRDPLRAFALVTVAVENAPDNERVWIDDMYHNIFCGLPTGTRAQAQGMVAEWRQKYGRPATAPPRFGLGALPPQAQRTCSNGEAVPPPPPSRTANPSGPGRMPVPNSMLDIGLTSTEQPRR